MRATSCRLLFVALLAAIAASFGEAGVQPEYFQAQRLLIAGRDVTPFGAYVGLEVPEENVTTTDLELAFSLAGGERANASRIAVVLDARGGSNGWVYPPQRLEWNADCEYEAKSGRGVFRLKRLPLMRSAHYAFSVDVSRTAPDAPREPAYSFDLWTYPSLPDVGMGSLPFYVIQEQRRDFFLHWPPAVYEKMNRQVPPNTSLCFTLELPASLWPGDQAVDRYLRLFLVKLETTQEQEAFRPLGLEADLPRGQETVVYDGPAGGARAGFVLKEFGRHADRLIWLRKPAPGRPDYENADYLEPGRYYSLQFELARPPFAGKRYEATRFGVRPRLERRDWEVAADYQSSDFVDWHGDWFNGHLVPTNNVPNPQWGADYLLQKQAREDHPDLWRTVHFQYLPASFSSMFNLHLNLYRDRSQRAVVKAERSGPGEVLLTLAHLLGAQHFQNPDDPADTLASHPVVADDKEAIYRVGDEVILQGGVGGELPGFGRGRLLEATVKEVRPAADQVVLETKGELWPVAPEGPPREYPVILGPVGGKPAAITLPATYDGTYLRLRNGRPYANWGIANYMFDFFVDTMGLRLSIERYSPHPFVGDAITGDPSRAGWQLVSDCEYYFMRHLLRRYGRRGGLDTFLHPIFGEGTGWQWGGPRFVELYDYHADGILRAYEEVLGVRGDDYEQIRIGMGGVMLAWGLEYMVRWTLAHAVPAPLETAFPESASASHVAGKSLPSQPLGSNPLYYFTPQDRERFHEQRWDFNACFLDEQGKPIIGPAGWDSHGKLKPETVRRLLPGWRNSRWLLTHTRFGKGSPFRSVHVEGYGHAAEELAKCVLFEKELLAQVDANLRRSSSDPYVQTFLQGVNSGTIQLALFDWSTSGIAPTGKPFQGTGYWPTYFAEVMRRVIAEAARRPPGIFNVGSFTFDTFLGPDGGNSGTVSDTAIFRTAREYNTAWVDLGDGKQIELSTSSVTLEKDIRNFIKFIGLMTHRLAPLPEKHIGGHVLSGLISKRWDDPPPGVVSGNGPGEEHKFYVLLYDHYPPDVESQGRTEIPVHLKVRRLPLEAGQARVTVYRIDREHSSLYPVTETEAHIPRRAAQSGYDPLIYSPEEIAALRKASQLAKDESFHRNGGQFAISAGGLDLDLTLGANRVLFLEIDWG